MRVFHVGTMVLHMEHSELAPRHLAAAVTHRMDLAGLSLRETARGANIPPSTFTRRLNGSPFLSTELAALASVFGIPTSRLVGEAESIAAGTDSPVTQMGEVAS